MSTPGLEPKFPEWQTLTFTTDQKANYLAIFNPSEPYDLYNFYCLLNYKEECQLCHSKSKLLYSLFYLKHTKKTISHAFSRPVSSNLFWFLEEICLQALLCPFPFRRIFCKNPFRESFVVLK